MTRAVEIRTYRLKPETKLRFHDLVATQAVPMLQRHGIDVVAFGPSCDDDDGYVLIRAYDSIAELNSRQDAFYASAEWRAGPRQAILDLIDDHTMVVVEIEAPALQALRTVGAARMGGAMRGPGT